MFSRTVVEKRNGSCDTIPTARRSSSRRRSRTSAPSSSTRPSVGSTKRGTNWVSVVLPEAVGPISAMVRPAGTSRTRTWGTLHASTSAWMVYGSRPSLTLGTA